MGPECPRPRAGKSNLSQSHKTDSRETDTGSGPIFRISDDVAGENALAAWEMIESGRYMPRRIRGSFPGRELG
jgi:hypothetical protein